MESENLSDEVDSITHPDFIIVKEVVDHYIHLFTTKYNVSPFSMDDRNTLLLETFNLMKKNVLASPNSKYEAKKKTILVI
jgi:hypothetical protein